MKRFLIISFVLLNILFLVNVDSVSAKKYLGTVEIGSSSFKSLNLLDEFNNKTKFSEFLITHSTDLHYTLQKITDLSFSADFISVFNSYDLGMFSMSDFTPFEKCQELGCSYAFLNSRAIEYDDYTVTFKGLSYLKYFIFFDSNMNYLGYYLANGEDLKYTYWLTDDNLATLFNVLFYTSMSDINDNYFSYKGAYDSIVLQNIKYNGIVYNFSNSSGRHWFSNFFYRFTHNEADEISNNLYSIIDNDYIKYPIIVYNKPNDNLFFMDTLFVSDNSVNVPDGYNSLSSYDYKNGYYLIPTLDPTCKTDYDYMLYFYSDLLRLSKFNYYVLDRNFNNIGSAYFNSYTPYKVYNFHTIDNEKVTLNNINDRVFYFYKEYDSENITLYYNPICYNFIEGNISEDVVVNDNLTIPYRVTNGMINSPSNNYYGATNSINDSGNFNGFTGVGSDSYEFNISNIIKTGADGLKGLMSSISAVLQMVGAFLTNLPSEIYSVLFSGFTIGVIIIILKLFL